MSKAPEITPPFLAKSINELRVFDVVGRSRPVLSVRAGDTVEHVVHFLAKNHISSAPILDGTGEHFLIVDIQFETKKKKKKACWLA